MARTKQPLKRKPKTNACSKKTAVAKKTSNMEKRKETYDAVENQRSSERIFEAPDVKLDADGTVDGSSEDAVYEESDELKLQDIANIVIGDLKQVRVNDASFNIDAEHLSAVYSAPDLSKNEFENMNSGKWTSTQVNENYSSVHIVPSTNENNLEQEIVEVIDVNQCFSATIISKAVLNGDCDLKVEQSLSTRESFTESSDQLKFSIDENLVIATSPDEIDEDFTLVLEENNVDMNNVICSATSSTKLQTLKCDEKTEKRVINESVYAAACKNNIHVCPTNELSKLDISEPPNGYLSTSRKQKHTLNELRVSEPGEIHAHEKLTSAEEDSNQMPLLQCVDPPLVVTETENEILPHSLDVQSAKPDDNREFSRSDVEMSVEKSSTDEDEKESPNNVNVQISETVVFESSTVTDRFPDKVRESSKIFADKNFSAEPSSKQRSKANKTVKRESKISKIRSFKERKKCDSDSNLKEVSVKSSVKHAEKRRRSKRLKAKPEYHEKKEEVKLLATLKEKEKFDCENNSKNENYCGSSDVVPCVERTSKVDEKSIRVAEESTDMPSFQHIAENEYHTERSFSKDAERMICDCVLSKEEIVRGEMGCGEDCLNRLLLIECCSRCTLGERCTNKRFQKKQYAKCEAYKTKKKGYGLRVLESIPSGTFIMEYVGEVIDSDEFEERAMKYARGKIPHFYFMSLKSDCIIDATIKGNHSRFINHSCEPNAETQKWTVQGELRIGFFSKRDIRAGEEITFDYQLQRYGKQAQRCYCEAPSCSGWIGEDPDKQVDDEKRKEKKKKKRDEYLDWETALDEICQIGLINRHQTLSLNRLMVHAKELPVRMQILQLIEEGHSACRRLFVDYHGLPIIWSWMVDCTPEQDELKIQLLKTLMALPITNKTILIDSKVFSLVEQWAFAVEQKLQSEALSAQSVLESVEDIASAEETPVSEMAQKVLNQWSSLREAYRIPKKERIQQMKEHEREADQNVVKPRPRRLPLYAEKIRDRYHRNRYSRNKDFEKLYFDRLKDKRKRDSPERGRNFDRDHHRKSDNGGNKISRMEHRYLFEMKIREKEERKREEELLKRKWEGEEQNYWMQQNQNLYYSNQQHSMVSAQYVSSAAPANYTPEASAMMAPNMLSNIQALSTSRSHAYYNPTSSYMSPNIVLTHLTPPTSNSHSTQSILPSQVGASPQTYYQSSVSLTSFANNATPLPVPYPHHALNELTSSTSGSANSTSQRTDVDSETLQYSREYQSMQSMQTSVDEIPVPDDSQTSLYGDVPQSYEYKETVTSTDCGSVTNVQEQQSQRQPLYSAKELSAAIAAVATVDITKLKLPPKWKAARDSEGRIYYYHTKTRVSQWYPPAWEEPPLSEETDQIEDGDYSSEEESSDEEDEEVEARRRRRKNESVQVYSKRQLQHDVTEKESEQNSFDMDAELRENLAAMSSEFQDSDNEDYSPVTKDIVEQKRDLSDADQSSKNIPVSTVPLITEHIISPREPIDERERIRTKRRIKSLKERLRKQKKQQKLLDAFNSENSSLLDANNGISINNSLNNSNNSSKLLSVPADTSSITDRKRKDVFRSNMANFVVNCLNPYFRRSCSTGRITNGDDFKHLARKLTHFVMLKELKHCRNATDLSCNSSVKHKAKEYIRKYMSKFGEVYVRPPDDSNY